MAISIWSLFWKYMGYKCKSLHSRVERASELESDTAGFQILAPLQASLSFLNLHMG